MELIPELMKLLRTKSMIAVFASEWNRRFGPFPSEWEEAGSLAASEHDAQHTDVPGAFHSKARFFSGNLLFSQSTLLGRSPRPILSELNIDGDLIITERFLNQGLKRASALAPP